MIEFIKIKFNKTIVVDVIAYDVQKRLMGKSVNLAAVTQTWYTSVSKYNAEPLYQKIKITNDMLRNNPVFKLIDNMKAKGCSNKQILDVCERKNSLFRQYMNPRIVSLDEIPPTVLKNMPKRWLHHSMFTYFDERIQQDVYFPLSHDDNKYNKVFYSDKNGNPIEVPTEFISKTDIKGVLQDQFLWLKAKVFGPGTWKPRAPTLAQQKYLEDNFHFFAKFTLNSFTYIHGPAGTGFYFKVDKYGTVVRVYEEKYKVITDYF